MIQTAVSPYLLPYGATMFGGLTVTKLYRTSTSLAGCLYRLAAVVVLATRSLLARSRRMVRTTEHATAATLEWAKAAGCWWQARQGRFCRFGAAFWAGRLCLCICNGRTDRF